jgi:ABC-type polar amino acid transport system ATPase subunit
MTLKKLEPMTVLTITHLNKTFGHNPVLKNLSLSTEAGNVVVLLGSSGSGKSTLLRCINQLETPEAGQIDVAGLSFQFGQKPIASAQLLKLRSHVGMVFQQFNLWPHRTLLQNLIEAPIKVLKLSKKEAIAQAQALLATVGLSDKANAHPVSLSGGQQQRAAIARALMMKPTLMLFDEPTSALDPENVNEVLSVMVNLAKSGMTMLIATHEIGFAKKVATHAVFLEKGSILESGTADILLNPKTERFRRFLTALAHTPET